MVSPTQGFNFQLPLDKPVPTEGPGANYPGLYAQVYSDTPVYPEPSAPPLYDEPSAPPEDSISPETSDYTPLYPSLYEPSAPPADEEIRRPKAVSPEFVLVKSSEPSFLSQAAPVAWGIGKSTATVFGVLGLFALSTSFSAVKYLFKAAFYNDPNQVAKNEKLLENRAIAAFHENSKRTNEDLINQLRKQNNQIDLLVATLNSLPSSRKTKSAFQSVERSSIIFKDRINTALSLHNQNLKGAQQSLTN